jgi:hypothetical protein
MRPEPPAHYRPTVVERFGLQALFSLSARIIPSWASSNARAWLARMSWTVRSTVVASLHCRGRVSAEEVGLADQDP